jgi:hypothetical protein
MTKPWGVLDVVWCKTASFVEVASSKTMISRPIMHWPSASRSPAAINRSVEAALDLSIVCEIKQ